MLREHQFDSITKNYNILVTNTVFISKQMSWDNISKKGPISDLNRLLLMEFGAALPRSPKSNSLFGRPIRLRIAFKRTAQSRTKSKRLLAIV